MKVNEKENIWSNKDFLKEIANSLRHYSEEDITIIMKDFIHKVCEFPVIKLEVK